MFSHKITAFLCLFASLALAQDYRIWTHTSGIVRLDANLPDSVYQKTVFWTGKTLDPSRTGGWSVFDGSKNKGMSGFQNTESFRPSYVSGFLSFDGLNDFYVLPQAVPMNYGTAGDFSVLAWVQITASNRLNTLIDKRSDTTSDGFLFYFNAPNRLIAQFQKGVSAIVVTNATSLTTGAWNHICVSITRSSKVEFYINGVLDKSQSTATTSLDISVTNTARIGNKNNPASGITNFIGNIDGVIVVSDVVASNVAHSIYTQTKGAYGL